MLLLDSSAIIRHFRGRLPLFELYPSDTRFGVPLVVLGELRSGILQSGDPAKGDDLLRGLLEFSEVILPTIESASFYAKVVFALEQKGQRIPQNDLWIAAGALQLALPVVTCDAHFDRVPGLIVLRH